MKKKLTALLMAAILVLSMLAGCSVPQQKDSGSDSAGNSDASSATQDNTASDNNTGDTPAASGQKVFRYATGTEPTTLDATKGNSVADNELMHLTCEGLIRNNCGTIEPGLAETWEVSEDGATYTFHLRDAQWPDGQPITSQDFLYAFRRLADPATASPYAWILDGHVKNGGAVVNGTLPVEELGVSAPDDKTFVVELEYAQNYMLSLMGSCCQFTPVRQDIVEQYGTDYAADASKLMTYGPFIMTSSANRVYVMEKNPNYWNADAIKLDRVEMNVIDNGDTQLAMYEQGELDYVQIPTAQVANYLDVSSDYMNGSLDWCYINTEAEFVSNQNLCLALNYAIDRNTYNMLANSNTYTAWGNPVMPAVDGVNATYGEEFQPAGYPIEGDLTKAQEYLNTALTELGLSSPSDITIEMVITDAETEKKIGETLQEMWQTNLGINIELRQVTYAEKYGNVCPDGDFQIVYAGWSPDYADPYTYLELFISTNVYNYSNYSNEEFDALMLSTQSMTDPTERLETLAKAEQVLIDTGAVIPLQVRTGHYLIDDDVTGVNFYFSGYNLDVVYADCAAS